jgi:hypothetical protein
MFAVRSGTPLRVLPPAGAVKAMSIAFLRSLSTPLLLCGALLTVGLPAEAATAQHAKASHAHKAHAGKAHHASLHKTAAGKHAKKHGKKTRHGHKATKTRHSLR